MVLTTLVKILADPLINEEVSSGIAEGWLLLILGLFLIVVVIAILKFAFGGGKQKEVIKEFHVKEVQTSSTPQHRTHCGQCGANLDKDTPFCPYCGAQL